MEAGYSRTHYRFWRLGKLPSLKTMARFARMGSGWPSWTFDQEDEELRLAKGWLEGEARRAAAAREEQALSRERESAKSSADNRTDSGTLMTTSKAQELIQQEIEDGRPVTLKAFEQALRRAARKARANPDLLPLPLGGQHEDWQLVELAPESGGHGNGHRLRRRQALRQR